MNSTYIFLEGICEIMIPWFLFTWWFKLLIIILIGLGVWIYVRIKINRIKSKNSVLKQRLQEQTELLSYAVSNEQKSINDAELANRSKSQLLTRIGHEIRTPMNGVIGMASLLSETSLTTEQREYADSIRSSGEKLLTVINEILMNDILEYSKVESGKALDPKDFDLVSSIEEVLEVFANKAAYAGVELLYKIDQNVPTHIIGDIVRLRQILMNLIDNAIKFTKHGEIFIGVRLLDSSNEKVLNIGFEVRDTGKGMTYDNREYLRQHFSEVNSVTNIKAGAGLGLDISKRLVALMGGQIEVESKEGVGTTFKFNVYIHKSLQPVRTDMHHDRDGLEGKRVLIVDDNDTSASILKTLIEQWKLVAVKTSSAQQALEILKETSEIELVITDLKMPEMDGIELSKEIRIKYPNIPIILLSNAGDESSKQYPDLFSSVLYKPFKQHLLSTQVFGGLRKQNKPALKEKQHSIKKLTPDFAQQYPLRILVGEDDAMNQQLAIKILNKLGYKPDIADNGQDVLEIVSHDNYDLILMDVQMPVMDGLEATRMIRLCLSVQPIIIAMTANSMQGDREECLRSGMDDYISKPVNIIELVNIIEKWALEIKAQQ